MKLQELSAALQNGGFDRIFRYLYEEDGEELIKERLRYLRAAERFSGYYGKRREVELFSAPGRTEIGGNHTDHQHGCVLAASVNMDAIAVASKNEDGKIRIKSEGFSEDVIDLSDLSIKENEKNGSVSLIRGIAAWFQSKGGKIGGFDAYTTSNVLSGSGLSSSAAFEVLVGTILNGLYNGQRFSPVEIAQAGQYAENTYFGKPSGLLDQASSSVGGFVAFDFADPQKPLVEKVTFDFSNSGYTLCVVDTHASHANLTPDYAAIPKEMKAAAAFFGKDFLRDVPEEMFYQNLREVRKSAGDRAVLRAMHFFAENRRAQEETKCLKTKDLDQFFQLLIDSGRSSFMYLQNVYSPAHPEQQAVSLTLGLCERLLSKTGGSWRIQGGGFAGTVQAFVPNESLELFRKEIDAFLGEGSCHVLKIRPVGGVFLTQENGKEICDG